VVIFISHCELRLPQKDFLLLLLVFVPQEFCYCRLVKSYFSPAIAQPGQPSRADLLQAIVLLFWCRDLAAHLPVTALFFSSLVFGSS
jgi:hypothetical protein